jgi:hypothetical protein
MLCIAGKPGLEVAYEDEHMACIVKPQVSTWQLVHHISSSIARTDAQLN